MEPTLFGGIPVRSRATALRWYERLLGGPPSFFPNDSEAVWMIGGQRYLYIDVRPDHAGHAMHTLFFDDVGAHLATLAGRGLEPDEIEVYDDERVQKATFHDPDGNEIAIAGSVAQR